MPCLKWIWWSSAPEHGWAGWRDPSYLCRSCHNRSYYYYYCPLHNFSFAYFSLNYISQSQLCLKSPTPYDLDKRGFRGQLHVQFCWQIWGSANLSLSQMHCKIAGLNSVAKSEHWQKSRVWLKKKKKKQYIWNSFYLTYGFFFEKAEYQFLNFL